MIKSLQINLNQLQHALIWKYRLKLELVNYILPELLDYLDCGCFYIDKEKGVAILVDCYLNNDFNIKKHDFMVYHE